MKSADLAEQYDGAQLINNGMLDNPAGYIAEMEKNSENESIYGLLISTANRKLDEKEVLCNTELVLIVK